MSNINVGLIATKVGTTSVFKDQVQVMVTVLKIAPNYITQLKSKDIDGYTAIQVCTGEKKAHRVTKALKGHYQKALENSEASAPFGAIMREFRVDNLENFSLGSSLDGRIFENIQKVDVTGISKGKGFAGTVKRHNFACQFATHGNSRSHRVPGSTGQNQSPGRVFKGKKMAGHMGAEQVTVQSMKIVEINLEKQYMLIEGSVPGAPGGYVIVKPAVKSSKKVEV